MKIFEQFKISKEFIEQTKFVKIYMCIINDKVYKIIFTKKIANKRTIIHFIDNTVYWEQAPYIWRLAGKQNDDKIPIYKFDTSKISNTIFVVRGTPLGDEGLDADMFRSFKNYNENFVNCITYRKFKRM